MAVKNYKILYILIVGVILWAEKLINPLRGIIDAKISINCFRIRSFEQTASRSRPRPLVEI